MFGSCSTKLDGEMLPFRFGFWISNIIFAELPGGKSTGPRKFNVFHISPLTFLNLVLIPGTKLDRHPALRQGVSTSLSLLLGRPLSTFLHAFVDACVSFDPEIPFSMFPNDQKNMLSSFYGSFKLIFKTIISFVLRQLLLTELEKCSPYSTLLRILGFMSVKRIAPSNK